MKNSFYWLIITAVISFTIIQCKRKSNSPQCGCKDLDAINYDQEAICDSNNCIYAADIIIGTYACVDSYYSYIHTGQSSSYITYDTINVTKTNNDSVVAWGRPFEAVLQNDIVQLYGNYYQQPGSTAFSHTFGAVKGDSIFITELNEYLSYSGHTWRYYLKGKRIN